MGLETYKRKRNFDKTPEPEGKVEKSAKQMRFVVQEHHASRLHFDFRLEIAGVLKSWSVPKGPTLDPSIKRLAVETEDHPISYLYFEGRIPEGSYGAGEHLMWDTGTFELLDRDKNAHEQYKKGRLNFRLKGKKLNGVFSLVKMDGRGERQWLLIKARDEFAEDGWQLKLRLDTDEKARVWHEMMEGKTSKKSNPKKHYEKRSVKKIRTKGDAETIPAEEFFAKRKLEGNVNVKVGKDIVALSNLHKVFWEDEGYTKGDLIRYYYQVSDYILPHLKDRPLIMKRYPDGIKGFSFHQHDVDEVPRYARTVNLIAVEGHNIDYLVCNNTATLLYMANLGAVERHPWHSRIRNIDKPDWFVFDLDPGKGVEFQTICEVALSLRDALDEMGLKSYVKTSGSRGLHVYVPVKPKYTYEEIEKLAENIAAKVAEENPKVATIERSMKKRETGQIYVDYLQNARGKSVVAPYSVRPRAGATVSAPLEWKEVEQKKIKMENFTIRNMLRRIKLKGELFSNVLKDKQSLSNLIFSGFLLILLQAVCK